MFKAKRCKRCEGKIKDSFDFCPYCGFDLRNPEKDLEDFGLLGKGNHMYGLPLIGGGGFGITDSIAKKILKNFMNSIPEIMKNLETQMDDMNPQVKNLPNGIQIRVGGDFRKRKKKSGKRAITQEQVIRMSKLPRVEAKAGVRRYSDKVVYEIKAPGIDSVDDVFVSKLESGYEIKAIGKKKVYVNSIPVNLPLRGYSISEDGLNIEFALG